MFSPEVPPGLGSPRGRGFLTSFVLAPPRSSTCFGSWLVLPGRSRGSEYVCVTDPERSATGDPCPPLRLARGAVELTCAPVCPSSPRPSRRSAAQLMASRLRAAARGSPTRRHPGLGKAGRRWPRRALLSCLLQPAASRGPPVLGKRVSPQTWRPLWPRGSRAPQRASSPGPLESCAVM